jgi:hypothetical protein
VAAQTSAAPGGPVPQSATTSAPSAPGGPSVTYGYDPATVPPLDVAAGLPVVDLDAA